VKPCFSAVREPMLFRQTRHDFVSIARRPHAHSAGAQELQQSVMHDSETDDPEVIGACPNSTCGLAGTPSSSLTASGRRYDVVPILMRPQGRERGLGVPSSASAVERPLLLDQVTHPKPRQRSGSP
jgi:hypothetical protein